MRFRTALARVRGLGAAKEGALHWWQERLTSAAAVPLTVFLIWLGLKVHGRDHAGTVEILRHPIVTIGLIVTLSTMFWHMMLGMQVIIEDYVHGKHRVWLLIANRFFAAVFWTAGLYAVLRLSFGAN
jgi:succinate dehydrogenase / fumarate reductase, membrane anchor subunit